MYDNINKICGKRNIIAGVTHWIYYDSQLPQSPSQITSRRIAYQDWIWVMGNNLVDTCQSMYNYLWTS